MKIAPVGWLVLLLLGCGGGGQASGEAAQQARDNGEPTGDSADPVQEPRDSDPAAPSPEGDRPRGGKLAITVVWPEAPAALRGSPGRDPCGQRRPAPLGMHTLGGVRNALVWLEAPEAEPETGRNPAAPGNDAGDTTIDPAPAIALDDCRLEPRVLLLPRQVETLIVRSDSEARQRVSMRRQSRHDRDKGSPGDAIDFWLPVVGSQVAVPMTEPGLWRIESASDPGAPSYVMSIGREHVALTDERGVARLEQVPAGSYTLTVWHPPVRAGQPAIHRSVAIDTKKAREITISLASQ